MCSIRCRRNDDRALGKVRFPIRRRNVAVESSVVGLLPSLYPKRETNPKLGADAYACSMRPMLENVNDLLDDPETHQMT